MSNNANYKCVIIGLLDPFQHIFYLFDCNDHLHNSKQNTSQTENLRSIQSSQAFQRNQHGNFKQLVLTKTHFQKPPQVEAPAVAVAVAAAAEEEFNLLQISEDTKASRQAY